MTERRRKFNCPTSATSSTVTWSTTTCSSRVRRSPQSAAGTRIEDVLATGLGAILAVEAVAALWFVLWGLLKNRSTTPSIAWWRMSTITRPMPGNGLDRPHRKPAGPTWRGRPSRSRSVA